MKKRLDLINRSTGLVRVDKEWERVVREDIMGTRLKKGLAKPCIDEMSIAEFTRLQMRAPSWPKLAEELKTLPKRRQ